MKTRSTTSSPDPPNPPIPPIQPNPTMTTTTTTTLIAHAPHKGVQNQNYTQKKKYFSNQTNEEKNMSIPWDFARFFFFNFFNTSKILGLKLFRTWFSFSNDENQTYFLLDFSFSTYRKRKAQKIKFFLIRKNFSLEEANRRKITKEYKRKNSSRK